MSRKLRIGVLGTGKIGRLHLESVMHRIAEAQVVHVADPYMTDEIRSWLTDNGVQTLSDDASAVFNDPEVEAVMICSPTDMHVDHLIAAAQAKKHIFCEKPVHFDLEKILETLKVVKDAKVKFQIGFNRRFDHNFKRIHEEVQSGVIGEPHVIKITSRDPAPPPVGYLKSSGGIFMDQMIHDFDMIRYLSGREVVSVYARGAVRIDPVIGELGDVDTAVVTLEFDDGTLGIIDNSRQAVYGYDQRAEVFGSKGCLVADNDSATRVSLFTKESVQTDTPPYFFLQRYFDAYVEEMKYFVQAVLEDTEPLCSFYDAILPVVIAKAAKQSLQENRPVNTEDILGMQRIHEVLA